MRIGVGLAFFSSGLEKYRSIRLRHTAFTQAYKIPLVDPAVAARVAMVNELTCSTLSDAGNRNARGDPPVACDASGASARLPGRLAG